MKDTSPLAPVITPSCSQRTIRSMSSPSFQWRYLRTLTGHETDSTRSRDAWMTSRVQHLTGTLRTPPRFCPCPPPQTGWSSGTCTALHPERNKNTTHLRSRKTFKPERSLDAPFFHRVCSYHAQTLLAEVVVDVRGLHGQVPRRVEGVPLILRRLVGSLAHSEQIWEWQTWRSLASCSFWVSESQMVQQLSSRWATVSASVHKPTLTAVHPDSTVLIIAILFSFLKTLCKTMRAHTLDLEFKCAGLYGGGLGSSASDFLHSVNIGCCFQKETWRHVFAISVNVKKKI